MRNEGTGDWALGTGDEKRAENGEQRAVARGVRDAGVSSVTRRRPNGAIGCSHGWSDAQHRATRGKGHQTQLRPDGAVEWRRARRLRARWMGMGVRACVSDGVVRGVWADAVEALRRQFAHLLRPFGAAARVRTSVHGLRCAREDAGCAPPAATADRSFEAKRRSPRRALLSALHSLLSPPHLTPRIASAPGSTSPQSLVPNAFS